jgi:hypothetical protein
MSVQGKIWPYFFELTHLRLVSYAKTFYAELMKYTKNINIILQEYIFFQNMLYIRRLQEYSFKKKASFDLGQANKG